MQVYIYTVTRTREKQLQQCEVEQVIEDVVQYKEVKKT